MRNKSGLTLLLGGARSGKSALAVELAKEHSGVVWFIATAQARDDDMRERIVRHRQERPSWKTIEEPIELSRSVGQCPTDALVIIDCLTLWVSNMLLRSDTQDEMLRHSMNVLGVVGARTGATIAVSNEVGLGVHPETDLGRQYRDMLGRINQQWARAARQSLFLVAGRAISLINPKEFLE